MQASLLHLIEGRKELQSYMDSFYFRSLTLFPIYKSFLQKSPSNAVSIRAIEIERYKVINKQTNEVLEEIEESSAFFQVSTLVCPHLLYILCHAK